MEQVDALVAFVAERELFTFKFQVSVDVVLAFRANVVLVKDVECVIVEISREEIELVWQIDRRDDSIGLGCQIGSFIKFVHAHLTKRLNDRLIGKENARLRYENNTDDCENQSDKMSDGQLFFQNDSS